MLEETSYSARLPKKRMAAGALFFDAQDRVLIVQPTYRPEWLLPGGSIELDESPRSGCAREVQEELGLTVTLGRLLCVEYRSSDAQKTESLQFIFLGGYLSAAQIALFALPADELVTYSFLPFDAAVPKLDIRLGCAFCWHAQRFRKIEPFMPKMGRSKTKNGEPRTSCRNWFSVLRSQVLDPSSARAAQAHSARHAAQCDPLTVPGSS